MGLEYTRTLTFDRIGQLNSTETSYLRRVKENGAAVPIFAALGRVGPEVHLKQADETHAKWILKHDFDHDGNWDSLDFCVELTGSLWHFRISHYDEARKRHIDDGAVEHSTPITNTDFLRLVFWADVDRDGVDDIIYLWYRDNDQSADGIDLELAGSLVFHGKKIDPSPD